MPQAFLTDKETEWHGLASTRSQPKNHVTIHYFALRSLQLRLSLRRAPRWARGIFASLRFRSALLLRSCCIQSRICNL